MKVKNLRMMMAFLLMGIFSSFAQEKSISGNITDQDGLPLPGVNILVQGTTNGTQSDFDGNYTIKANTGQILLFTYIGQKDDLVTVGQSSIINVQMKPSTETLDEVIVVAYGTSTKEAFTGSAEVIRAADLELRATTSPIAAIEGAVTGLQVVAASGQPGSSPTIVIRGVGSLNGGFGPLYILDGIQFDGDISSLNQNDIASMTVLKDAASTALYGSRAAGGVIIITTKKGKSNSGIKVNVSSQLGVISKAIPEYDAVNPGQYYELMWEAYKNSLNTADPAASASANIYNRLGYNPFNVANDQIVGTDGKLNPNAQVNAKSLDWYDALEQTGDRQNHSISVSGGGEKHDVYFSSSYLKEKGFVIKSDFRRVTSRLNANFSPTDWLKVGGNVSISETSQTGTPSRGTSIANPFNFAKDMASIYPVYLVDPTTGDFILDQNGERQFDLGEGYSEYGIRSRPTDPGRHAVAETLFNSELTEINNLGYRYYADFKLLEGLNIKTTYGRDVQDSYNQSYENNIVGDGAPTGRYSETRFRRTIENFNQILTYNKTFGTKNNLTFLLGHESFNRHFSRFDGTKTTQSATGITEFDNFSVAVDIGGSSTDKTTEGYFSRLDYNYDQKYYLSLSARRDGTSVFNSDARWGNFYSIGASWRIDQEDFMQNVSFIDRLKLRASYGEVGNDDLGNFYISQALYQIYPNAGTPGAFWNTTGSSILSWETVESFDVALEFGLFNNRLEGSIEYYKKTSSDLLYNVPIAPSLGLNAYPGNIGDMFNSGFELGLTGHIVRNDNFSWDLGLQASTLKNEITSLPDPFVNGSKRWDVGRSRYDFYIYHYAGVDSANGDALYYMWEENPDNPGQKNPVLNADGTQATTNDWQDAGKAYVEDANPIPDVIGSVKNTVKYKNFALDFTFTFSIGGDILDNGYANLMHEGRYGVALHPDALNAWRAPGDITDVPRLQVGDANQSPTLTTRFLTDATYYALRNVNLSYSFENKITDKIGVDQLRFFVSGENLFVKTEREGLNPQFDLNGTTAGNDFNPSRVVSFGLNVSF